MNFLYFNPGYSNASYIIIKNSQYAYSEKFNVIYLNRNNYTLSTEITYSNGSVRFFYSNVSYNSSLYIINILNLNPHGPFPEINSSTINEVENNSPDILRGIYSFGTVSYRWKFSSTNTFVGIQKSLMIILNIQNSLNYFIKYYANFSISNGILLNENISKNYNGNYTNESIILSLTNLFQKSVGFLPDILIFIVMISFIAMFVYVLNKKFEFIKDHEYKKNR
ncbi:MAG: hypothetical protein ACP5T9_01820 [Thermoplasmata archaeon]